MILSKFIKGSNLINKWGIVTSLIFGIIGLAYEAMSNCLYVKRAPEWAFIATERNVNLAIHWKDIKDY